MEGVIFNYMGSQVCKERIRRENVILKMKKHKIWVENMLKELQSTTNPFFFLSGLKKERRKAAGCLFFWKRSCPITPETQEHKGRKTKAAYRHSVGSLF